MSSSDISSTDRNRPEQRLNHAVSITLGQQFVHSCHNCGREGVITGIRDRPAPVEDESADVRGHGCGAESNDATMRTPVHTHRLLCRRCHGIHHSGDILILPLCIGSDSNPPEIASVDLLNFQHRRV
jgi:hypothetical protein